MNLIGIILIIAGAVLLVLAILFSLDGFTDRIRAIQAKLNEFELFVASLPNKWLVLIAVLLLFCAKAFIPIPIPTICLISGIVFPSEWSFIINIVGISILLTIKFFWGKRFGPGAVGKLYSKNEAITAVLESKAGRGNPWLLFGLRIVPYAPLNMVSQIYGSMNCEYDKFMMISLLGFMPKLLSYTIIGQNVFNPFSLAFILPIVILLMLSGVSLIIFNLILEAIQKQKNTAKSILKEDE
jgi:uncharacterized membrane protein YdjX (TVP38/TMEM64 family)